MRDRGAAANSPAYLSSLAAAVTYPASRARLASSGWTLHESRAIQPQYKTPSRPTSPGPHTGRPCPARMAAISATRPEPPHRTSK